MHNKRRGSKEGPKKGLSHWAQPGTVTRINNFDWRHIDSSNRPYSILNSGFAQLDQAFQLGGWPLKTTTELGLPCNGIGELRLLLPALRQVINGSQGQVIWLAPPYLPYAPALLKENIAPKNLVIVRPQNPNEALWAAEEILKSDAFAALFTWTDRYNLTHKQTRRLQLATEASNTWHVHFRHISCLQNASAARLRLGLRSHSSTKLTIDINKQPLGMGGQTVVLSLSPHYEQWRQLKLGGQNHFKPDQSTNKDRNLPLIKSPATNFRHKMLMD